MLTYTIACFEADIDHLLSCFANCATLADDITGGCVALSYWEDLIIIRTLLEIYSNIRDLSSRRAFLDGPLISTSSHFFRIDKLTKKLYKLVTQMKNFCIIYKSMWSSHVWNDVLLNCHIFLKVVYFKFIFKDLFNQHSTYGMQKKNYWEHHGIVSIRFKMMNLRDLSPHKSCSV